MCLAIFSGIDVWHLRLADGTTCIIVLCYDDIIYMKTCHTVTFERKNSSSLKNMLEIFPKPVL